MRNFINTFFIFFVNNYIHLYSTRVSTKQQQKEKLKNYKNTTNYNKTIKSKKSLGTQHINIISTIAHSTSLQIVNCTAFIAQFE